MKGLDALKEFRYQQTGVNVNADEYLGIVEKELKEREYLYHLLDALFEECEIESSAEYDEDLRKYVVEFKIDGKYKFHFYCDRKEYLFWREKSGVDDQYTPEDLR